ncbi:hypothetical protein JCM3765_000608 [Sporobolomyces pararoseus]
MIPVPAPPQGVELGEKSTPLLQAEQDSSAQSLDPLQLVQLLETRENAILVVDTSSMESYLESRIIGSINVSFPSLLCKRLSNRTGKSVESFKLEDFITTSQGKKIFQSFEGKRVVIIDDKMNCLGGAGAKAGSAMNSGRVLLSVLEKKMEIDKLYFLDRGLGEAAKGEEQLRKWIVAGESEARGPSPRPTTPPAPPPQARTRATLGKLDTSSSLLAPHSRPGVSSVAPLLSSIPATIDSPSVYEPSEGGGSFNRKAAPPRLNLESLKISGGSDHPDATSRPPSRQMSLHELCHSQSKSPSAQATRFSESDLALPSPGPLSPTSPSTTNFLPSPNPIINEDALPPFEPSMIIDEFLFLGQEPTTLEDFTHLDSLGITEILNLAVECQPLPTDHHHRVQAEEAKFVEKYWYLPIRDSIEETRVAEVLDRGCEILDDARLRGRKVYVHCFLGRSRSCMLVLAYLMHLYHWHLQRAYNYVASRREKISPNLGFMAELMSFEERLNSRISAHPKPTSSLSRSKSASLQPTKSAALLLSSPVRSSTPDVTSARPTTRYGLERGTSDLGPNAVKAAGSASNASRAVRSLLFSTTTEADQASKPTSTEQTRSGLSSTGSANERCQTREADESRVRGEEVQEVASLA